MIWTDTTVAQNVTLDFRAKLENSPYATPFSQLDYDKDLAGCEWFYQALSGGGSGAIIGYRLATAFAVGGGYTLNRPMRNTPSVSDSSPGYVTSAPGTGNNCALRSGSGAYLTKSGTFSITWAKGPSPTSMAPTFAAGTSFSGTGGDVVQLQFGSGVITYFDAELGP